MKLINKGEILTSNVYEIYNEILQEYNQNGSCIIDFYGVKSMTSMFAAKLFGGLYETLGKNDYYNNIHYENITDDLKEMIKTGIANYLYNLMP